MKAVVEMQSSFVQRPVRVFDGFYGGYYEAIDTVELKKPVAMVEGIRLSAFQTEQALRDARLCRCSTCLCCAVLEATKEAERRLP